MIYGTSKFSLNLDPINGKIWTRGPRIYGFYYTKTPQTILESIWGHPGKYYFYIYGLQKNVKFGKDGHRKMMKIRLIKSPKSWM